MRKITSFLVVVLASILTSCSTPVPPADRMAVMQNIAYEYGAKRTVCINLLEMDKVKQSFDEYSEAHPEKGGNFSAKEIYLFLAKNYPCPFNSKTSPVRQAVSTDLIGYWELVPDSVGNKVNQFKQDPFPSDCEYYAFYENGDMLSLQMMMPNGNSFMGMRKPCPSVSAADFASLKSRPKVIGWKVGPDGVLKITRTDIPNYIESWEAFIPTNIISMGGYYKPGDLLLFMTQFNQTKKGEIGTLYFRHFRKIAK